MAMKDPLAKLLGGAGRLKIMRLFMARPDECLRTEDVSRLSKTIKTTTTKELKALTQIGFIKQNKCKIEETKKLKKGVKKVIKSKPGFILNQEFTYLPALRTLLTNISNEQNTDIIKKIRKIGRIKGLILAGLFLQDEDARVDILVIGDSVKHRQLENTIKSIEADLGQSLRYSLFSTNEFIYRYDMRDKLICDILDSPHKKLINRLGL